MKKKIFFVINPISGVKEKKELEKLIPKKLDLSIFDYEIAYTHAPHHATLLCKDAIAHGFDIIAAVGGDGTVNEVGKGVVDTDATMCIIPMGSGNGLARHLGIPMNTGKAISLLNRAKSRIMDTVTINNRLYLGVAGVGFDAHISSKFSTMKKRGFFRYLQLVIQEFRKYKPQQFEITIDGKHFPKNAFLISFANSSQYGNNFIIAPKAHINDGLIEITVVNKFPFIRSIEMGIRLFLQSIDKFPYAETFKAKEITVKGDHFQAHIDGEPVQFLEEMHIQIQPNSLKILAP